MSSAASPRLTGGVVASVLLHGGLVAAFLVMRSPPPLPSPPMIRVRMVAAPAGDRAIGAVQPQPVAAAEAPPPKPSAAKPRPIVPAAKPKVAPPKAVTQTAPPKTLDAKPPTAPQPVAGGGPVGGRGTDVANIDTPGITFDYPIYTTNIVRELIKRFGPMAGRLEAEVRFVIRRDGSVDPASIRIVTGSGNYSFDQKALTAVETAANAKAFGPLPAGFREDILPVTFRFSPSVIK